MDLLSELKAYVPYNQQEQQDRALLVAWLQAAQNDDALAARLWGRGNPAHLTASAWVVSPDRSVVLMAYHNLYDSWAWLGGHADGQRDLRAVALREVREESGLAQARLASPDILSVEVLTVDGHEKRGAYVSSHLHLNVTFLVEADPVEPLRAKPDENRAVAWMAPEEALARSTEPWFVERIYSKLVAKARAI
jgi:ADP-ribose pyrophosphatase YjhB (NUDIX family)